jgi:hypothetical protein
MNKIILVGAFFIIFVVFEILLYYIYKNKKNIKESFLESYQGSETNYESCIKSGYPQKWCLRTPEPYGIPNPDSLLECNDDNKNNKNNNKNNKNNKN